LLDFGERLGRASISRRDATFFSKNVREKLRNRDIDFGRQKPLPGVYLIELWILASRIPPKIEVPLFTLFRGDFGRFGHQKTMKKA